MKTKFLEIRDHMTSIPALAIEIAGEDDYLAMRAGFGGSSIYLVNMAKHEIQYDPFKWDTRFGRTMKHAHRFIQRDWEKLENGDVVDVEFLLGETPEPKVSERIK